MILTEQIARARLTAIRDAQPISNRAARAALWERCWSEATSPGYFNVGNTHEFEQFTLLRDDIYRRYFSGVTTVCEFGCGLGENLLALPEGVKRRGFDWSPAAVAKCRAKGIDARVFDMFRPDAGAVIEGEAVLTIHAMEQLGRDWLAFYHYLRLSRPALVVHVEPLLELYDELSLEDFLSICYHRRRGYLEGYLPQLEADARRGAVRILERTKSPFGNQNHKAYSTLVWRPI